jgi:hypothetical protein
MPGTFAHVGKICIFQGQYLVKGKVGVSVLSKVESSGNIELCHEIQPELEQM